MSTTAVLLERETEAAQLTDLVARAAAGAGGIAVVEGAAGIGKTQLLGLVATAARESGATVLRARAGEMEQSFAFGVVRQLFDAVLAGASAPARERHLEGAAGLAAPLFDPAGMTAATDEAMYPILHGLYWLCANLSRDQALVLCVDDAQWCDEPSLLFLEFLARRVTDLPVAEIIATRPMQPTSPRSLVGLVADASTDAVRPAALSHAATATLLAERLGAASDPSFTDACQATTGGNPFLVKELARRLSTENIVPSAEMAARVSELGPKAIADSVLLRVSRLSTGARALVEAIAVLGDDVEVADAALLAAVDAHQAEDLARELHEAGVLADGQALTFVHPVLRSAVYENIGSVARDRAHVDAARLLARAGRPAEQVAAHLLHVPRALGGWVLGPLRDAAAQALAVGDVTTAQRFLQRALVEELTSPEQAAVLSSLGHAQMLSMDPAAADTLGAAIATTEDPTVAVRAASDLGLMLLFSGRIEQFVAVLTDTESAVQARHPELAEGLGAGLLGATQISFNAASRLAPRVAALRDPGGTPSSVAERAALVALAYDAVISSRPIGEAQDLLRRSLAAIDLPVDRRDGLVGPMMGLGPMVMAELYGETDALISSELLPARRGGSAFAVAAMLSVRSWSNVRAGDLLSAETDAREALELIRAGDFASFHTGMAQASLLSCALETGAELGELQAILEAPAPDPDLGPHGLVILARARALAAQGETEGALVSLLAAGEGVYAEASPSFVAWRSTAATLLARLGRHDDARVLCDDEVVRARASGAPGALGAALRVQAGLASPGGGEALLEEAVAVLATSEARLEHARALVELGALIRRGGQRVRSRDHLREGHDMAVLAGATLLAATARRELATSGVRLPPRGLSGAESLTPSERRVAHMAADGMRNREIAQSLFVTEKTVETHLSRSYDKLGIRSRSALAGRLDA